MLSAEAIDAETSVVSDSVQAGAAILARKRRTIVGIDDTIASFVTFGTDTMVRSIRVSASGSISARRCHYALVNVFVAQSSGVSHVASAGKVEKV